MHAALNVQMTLSSSPYFQGTVAVNYSKTELKKTKQFMAAFLTSSNIVVAALIKEKMYFVFYGFTLISLVFTLFCCPF